MHAAAIKGYIGKLGAGKQIMYRATSASCDWPVRLACSLFLLQFVYEAVPSIGSFMRSFRDYASWLMNVNNSASCVRDYVEVFSFVSGGI